MSVLCGAVGGGGGGCEVAELPPDSVFDPELPIPAIFELRGRSTTAAALGPAAPLLLSG